MSKIEQENTRSAERPIDHLLEITTLLTQLKEFEVKNPPHPDVRKGLEIIESVLQLHKSWFTDTNTLVIYYGSLQYNDPINLDVDLQLIGQFYLRPLQKFGRLMDHEMGARDDWPRTDTNNGRCDAHVSFTSIDEIELVLKECREQEDWEWIEKPNVEEEDAQRDFDMAIIDMGLILSGARMYHEQFGLHEKMKEQVWELIKQYPFAQVPLIKGLEGVLLTRKQRKQKVQANASQ